jgi:hypothetical protein
MVEGCHSSFFYIKHFPAYLPYTKILVVLNAPDTSANMGKMMGVKN